MTPKSGHTDSESTIPVLYCLVFDQYLWLCTLFLTFVNLIFLNWLFNFLTLCQLSVSRFLKLFYCVNTLLCINFWSRLLLLFFSILSAIVFALKFLFIIIIIGPFFNTFSVTIKSCVLHACFYLNHI